jgi:hypothetical protein
VPRSNTHHKHRHHKQRLGLAPRETKNHDIRGLFDLEAAMTYFLKASTVLDRFLPELDGFKHHVDLSKQQRASRQVDWEDRRGTVPTLPRQQAIMTSKRIEKSRADKKGLGQQISLEGRGKGKKEK